MLNENNGSETDRVAVTASEYPGLDELLGSRLLASTPDCVKLIDKAGNLCFLNEAGKNLLEIDDFATIKGKPWIMLWPEEGRRDVEKALAVAAGGGVARFSGRCLTTKGTLKWWDVAVSPVRDATGATIWLLSIARDITQQKAAEESLRISEQRFRALADNMAQFAWMADSSGYIFWYNRRWFEYTGTTLAQMAGWGWKSVHHPDHIDRVVRKITACFGNGEVWEDTFPLRAVDGSYRWFLSRAMPIRDEHDKVVLWCGTNTDISLQRAASLRLRQKARLIELSHEAILVWDLEDGIQSWNRGCVELYGFDRIEAIGAVSHELLKTRHPMPIAAFEQNLRSEGSWSGEILHRAKDGSEVWVDSRHELISIGGRDVVFETNRDISERRRADEIRDLLIGELNHRVSNTLAIVQSLAIQTGRNSASIPEFVKRFSGRLQSLSSAHNVLTEAHWTGAGLRKLIRSQLQVTLGEGDRVTLVGDDIFLPAKTALQLTLVLYELTTNAIAHGALSQPQGNVSVSWKEVVKGDQPTLELTWLESGGPPVSPPAARGFGLTLIERTGTLPHIHFDVSFEPGGIRCVITTSLSDGNPDQPFHRQRDQWHQVVSRASLPGAQGRPGIRPLRRILIVENEPITAMELDEVLAEAGYLTLETADSTDNALKSISKLTIDAAIVNGELLNSPKDAVIAALQQRHIPFVIITDNATIAPPGVPDDVPRVKKPIVAAEVLEAVRAVT